MIDNGSEAIVIRYANNLTGHVIDTIAEHNRLFKEHSEVFIGKFGRNIKNIHIGNENLSKQKLALILVQKIEGIDGYEAYISDILHIQKKRPSPDLFPSYYRFRTDIRCWIKIKKPFKRLTNEELSRWIVKSSGNSLVQALYISMSGTFYTRYGEPRATSAVTIRRRREKDKQTGERFSTRGNLDDDLYITADEYPYWDDNSFLVNDEL